MREGLWPHSGAVAAATRAAFYGKRGGKTTRGPGASPRPDPRDGARGAAGRDRSGRVPAVPNEPFP